MRVLWIVNIMPPAIAAVLGEEATNKEGWITGLLDAVCAYNRRDDASQIQLGVAFPVEKERDFIRGALTVDQDHYVLFYGFRENSLAGEQYDFSVEKDLGSILEDFKPDMIHSCGTEYPHTLAAVKVFARPERTLVGIQGLCRVCASGYMANLPAKVRKSVTFRDLVRKDDLIRQQQKFEDRGQWELAAVQGSGHITGRTAWDRYWTGKWTPGATYHLMNETLRKQFYSGAWSLEQCEEHSIFLSQGDYPLKGLHYMLLALPTIRSRYPDVRLYVAGNSLMRSRNLTGRLKISAYGLYLEKLIARQGLSDCVFFVGRLDAPGMKERYLKSHVFVCPSTVENSPNSVGEAMLLGVPVVAARVGGIPTILKEDEGTFYEGFDPQRDLEPGELEAISGRLAEAVLSVFDDPESAGKKAAAAVAHARTTHDPERNLKRLLEIYHTIVNV